MRAIDTNVIVRLLVRDDVDQAEAADEFVRPGAWVSTIALTEAVWVLGSVFELSKRQLVRAIHAMLSHERLVFEDPELIAAALQIYESRGGVGFSDCLLLEIARKHGHEPLGTFDRQLAKLNGAARI
jgi:predicted nucleic-acid-binding protein